MNIRRRLPTLAAALALLAALAALGWGLTRWTTRLGERFEREQLQRLARVAAASLDPARVASLTATPHDFLTPDFQITRDRLARIRSAEPDARFVYLVTLRDDGVVFLADAEAPDSPDYSAPGDQYTEATPALRQACADGHPFVEGPYSDRWGTWVTGFAPIIDPATGRTVAVLGIDVGAARWLAMLDRYHWVGLALALLFGTIVLGSTIALCFLRRAARRQAALNRSLEQELAERRRLERELRSLNESLEQRVDQRTRELQRALDEVRESAEQRRRLEQRMQQAQKLESLGVLAGGVAHDFNNLLTGILGQAGLARAAGPTDGPLAEQLAQIELTARRAAELTRQLLAYSGRGQFHVRPLALPDLVRDTVPLVRASIPRAVEIRIDAPTDLPAVEADATQLRQVVMNLVLNAAEALGERPGTIRIAATCLDADDATLADLRRDDDVLPGRYVKLEVDDDGPGMTPELQERIFEPFFSTKFTGRGLGLAAVLGIVRGHHGAIGVRSSPGAGTTFTVLFPASDRPPDPRPEPTHPPSVPPPPEAPVDHGRGAVLVADDEPVVRRFAAFVLARMGFDVVQAEDGRGALDLFERHAPRIRLALLDLTMPRLDGEQTLRELRRLRPELPVVLSSGFDAATTEARTPRDRRTGFVHKPYRAEDLEDAVRAVLPPG
jgi:signal transduction histidine kinase